MMHSHLNVAWVARHIGASTTRVSITPTLCVTRHSYQEDVADLTGKDRCETSD